MNIGVWFDLRNPPGWLRPGSDLYAATLEQCEEAERLGLHSAWFSEHHGFEDGYLPQPLTFAAAAAARTRRIRVGTAVTLAPFRSPVSLAEEAAVVDLVSGGRLELGIGAGYRPAEFELFGADMTKRFATLDHVVGEVRELWRSGRVTPAPVQEDVPIWVGLHSPRGARRTGRAGERLMSGNPTLWPAYREGLLQGGRDLVTARMAGAVIGYVSEDPERSWDGIRRHLSYQWDSYARHTVERTDTPLPPPVDVDQLRARGLANRSGDGFLLATPEEWAVALAAHFEDVPLETAYFVASIAGQPDDVVNEHLRALARLQDLVASQTADVGEQVQTDGRR